MRKFLSISVTVLFQAIGVAQPEETRFDQIYRVNAVTQTVFCSDYRAKYPDLFRCMYDQNFHSSAGPYYSREPCPSPDFRFEPCLLTKAALSAPL